MDDRELLELAAKAAGYAVDCGFEDCPLIFGEDAGPDGPREWNPLTDDGDALRLAVKLGIQLHFEGGEKDDAVWANESMLWTDGQRLSASRRAIVLAAAEIGMAM